MPAAGRLPTGKPKRVDPRGHFGAGPAPGFPAPVVYGITSGASLSGHPAGLASDMTLHRPGQ
jgi:hypothetical protein